MKNFETIKAVLKDAPNKAMEIEELSKETGLSQDNICEAVRLNKEKLSLEPWDNFEKLYVVLWS